MIALVERQMSGNIERAHVRANMHSAIVCLHKCIVSIGGRMYLVDEDKAFPQGLVRRLAAGLVDKYHLLTHDTNVEYLTVSVLECLCGYGYDDVIFRHLVGRFCECLAAGNTLMVLFVHHTLLRLMDTPALKESIAASLVENSDIDRVVTCAYSTAVVCESAHLAVACVIVEMVSTAKQLDIHTFARVEQLVACVRFGCPAGLHENLVFLLARAALFAHGHMDEALAQRTLLTLADGGLFVCPPDSRTLEHINATLHFLLLQRRYDAQPETWHRVARFASAFANREGADTPLTTLAVLLVACRRMSYSHLTTIVEHTYMLSDALRDASFTRRPTAIGFVLRILRTFVRRTGPLFVTSLRRVVNALQLEISITALCVLCVSTGVASNSIGRAAVLYLAESLHAFAELRVFHTGSMQMGALNVLTNNLELTTTHNVQNITRTHKILLTLLRQVPQLAPIAEPRQVGNLISAAVRVCTSDASLRVSALRLLCVLHDKNGGGCACALGGGHEKRCHAVVAFCARALTAAHPSDRHTYHGAQELLLCICDTPAHTQSPSSPRVRKGIVNALSVCLRVQTRQAELAQQQQQQQQPPHTPPPPPFHHTTDIHAMAARNARITAAIARL